tara:strand:+ start:5327 stop:6037 length:711 start_codon:yes stop_codon:yes gene_type:complete
MTKEEIEEELLHNYPLFCILLFNLEKVLNVGLEWYRINFPELYTRRDFRPGTLGRYLAASITVRYHIDRTLDYLKSDNWDKDFVENYSFDIHKKSKYLGLTKDIDQSIRFYLFHSFYHQLETTIRILVDKLELNKEKGKPLNLVNKIVNCFPEDYIICLDALRNTIHNNGYYRPQWKQPKEVSYQSEDCNISFKENERLTLDTKQTISLIYELVEYTELMLKNEKVVSLPITNDRN